MRELPAVEGVEHRFVDVGGVRMHVARAGSGPPVLLLHGWPQHWWMWRRLIGPLAEGHRVLAPDLRGFGWTDAPPGGYDPEVFATDLVGLLRALEIDEPVHVIGHDWGGWTAFVLALRHPGVVRRLLALSIVHPFVRPGPRSLLGAWRLWYQWALATPGLGPAALRIAAARSPVLLHLGAGRGVWSDAELRAYADPLREPDRARATQLLYRHAALRLPRQLRGYRAMRLGCAARLVFPAEDAVQKAIELGGYEDNAPEMEIEVVPGAGHFIVEERPDLVRERALALVA
ncbi:MAG: putative hydrolase or acyltransferase of alpha/beta superfamily [Solirubrobacterales bacterium]|nr:putative hydrolase or acyltransferase of alpha/beta superfamily [Solirubrobacterales bacterium]